MRVTRIKANLERSLHFIRSVAEAGVDELRLYMGAIASLLVKGSLGKGPQLVGDLALQTYLNLSNCCSSRLGTLREWVGVATLRSLDVNGITEDYTVEALGSTSLQRGNFVIRRRLTQIDRSCHPSSLSLTDPF